MTEIVMTIPNTALNVHPERAIALVHSFTN